MVGIYVSVLLASITSMLVGFVWYSPSVFGNLWAKDMDKKKITVAQKRGMRQLLLVEFVSTLVTVFVLSYFLQLAGANSWLTGAKVGFWIWLGFAATKSLGGILWEGKSLRWYFITAGHLLVSLLVSGAVLGALI